VQEHKQRTQTICLDGHAGTHFYCMPTMSLAFCSHSSVSASNGRQSLTAS
jgi:hypothetical protein